MVKFDQIKAAADRDGRAPRFHGDGIIQLYLSKHVRLHVFHPNFPATVENARVHDHAWDMHSRVLLGRVTHKTYTMNLSKPGKYAINEARAGCGSTAGALTKCHQCELIPTGTNTFVAGSEYRFPRHEFHETFAVGLSMTTIQKSGYSPLPPRVISPFDEAADNAFGGVSYTEASLWDAIQDACGALKSSN